MDICGRHKKYNVLKSYGWASTFNDMGLDTGCFVGEFDLYLYRKLYLMLTGAEILSVS